MIRKGIFVCIVMICCVAVFSGCSSGGAKREIDTLGIVVGIAVDKGEKGEILLTAQIVRNDSVGQNASSQGSSNSEGDLGKAYWNVSTSGENLLEAVRSAVRITNRDLYMAQNHIVIISRDVAEGGIGEYLDYFFRNQEIRYDVDLVICEGKAADILNVESHLEELPAQDLYKMLKTQIDNGTAPKCTLFDFVRNYKTHNRANIVPVVSVIKPDDEKAPYLSVSKSAVFKEDKMVGFLDERETHGILWLLSDNLGGVVSFLYKGDHVSVEILKGKGDFKSNFSQGRIILDADIELECKLGEYQGGKYVDEDVLRELELLCKNVVEQELRDAVFRIGDMGVDILGVGEYLYRHNYSEWVRINADFEKIYKNLSLEMDVSADILRTGALVKSIEDV